MLKLLAQTARKGGLSRNRRMRRNGEVGPGEVSVPGLTETRPIIHIVDDDCLIRDSLRFFLEAEALLVEEYDSGEAFLHTRTIGEEGCLLLDARLPGMSGLELLQALRREGNNIPIVMITGHSDVAMAVETMKAGASDFLEKPVTQRRLVECVELAVKASHRRNGLYNRQKAASDHMDSLSPRETQIMTLVLAGHPSKNIAADIGISRRTVENHRASVMRKMGARSLPELARLVVRVDGDNAS